MATWTYDPYTAYYRNGDQFSVKNPDTGLSYREQETLDAVRNSPEHIAAASASAPRFEQGYLSQDPQFADYWQKYGAFPVGGTDEQKQQWMFNAMAGGAMTANQQDVADESSGWEGFMNNSFPLLATSAAFGGLAMGASGAFGEGAAGEAAAGGLVDAGMGVPELGLAEQSLTPMMPPAIAPETSAGYAASPWMGEGGGTLYSLTDPAAVAEAGLSGAGFAPTSELNPSSGEFSAPTGTSSAIQQLVKALTGGTTAGTVGGLSGYLQGGSPGSQGYVRKSRPPLTQPAFLGDQGQQPLGSAEDSAFNEMVAGRGEDTSTRARQMAAQLRGKPGFFGFRSG